MENENENEVTITDIKIPFWSIVIFMVKAAIASIPALIILGVIGSVFSMAMGGFFGPHHW
jgi:hypothetical protein